MRDSRLIERAAFVFRGAAGDFKVLLHRWTLLEGVVGVLCFFALPFAVLYGVVGTAVFVALCVAMLVSAAGVTYALRREQIKRIRAGLNLDDREVLRATASRAIVRGPNDS